MDTKIPAAPIPVQGKFRKTLGFLSATVYSINAVAILVDVIVVFGQGLTTGGPVVMIWGFIAAYGFTLIVATCMAEICAAYPVTGSVYYWSAQLVPHKYSPLASYTCGWINFFGCVSTKAVLAATFAGFLNAAVHITHGRTFHESQLVAVAIGTLFFWAGSNVVRID